MGFKRVLIANRGEIALRILRTLRDMGIEAAIIHGREDPLIPIDHGEYLSKNIPESKTLFLDGVGHEIPDQSLSEIIPAMVQNFSR